MGGHTLFVKYLFSYTPNLLTNLKRLVNSLLTIGSIEDANQRTLLF
jgi:hypothetical protein